MIRILYQAARKHAVQRVYHFRVYNKKLYVMKLVYGRKDFQLKRSSNPGPLDQKASTHTTELTGLHRGKPESILSFRCTPGRVAQSVGHLTRKRSWVRYPVWPHTFVSLSTDSRRAVVSYWRKYVHKVLVNRLGGLSLPRKSVVRLTDRPDMTLDVYRGRKTTTTIVPLP